jgi:acetoin utilization protein AcuB
LPGTIKELTDIIRSYGGRIASILGTYERVPAGQRLVYLRVYDIDRAKLAELQDDLQKKATLIYVVDHRENKRQVLRDLG